MYKEHYVTLEQILRFAPLWFINSNTAQASLTEKVTPMQLYHCQNSSYRRRLALVFSPHINLFYRKFFLRGVFPFPIPHRTAHIITAASSPVSSRRQVLCLLPIL